MGLEVYYAVDKEGGGHVYMTMPERDDHSGGWLGDQMGCVSALFMMLEADGMKLPFSKGKPSL